MSDFTSLNGYNVKDATARENIETLSNNMTQAQSNIQTLTNNMTQVQNNIQSLTNNMTQVQNEIDALQAGRKYIFIGDSYGEGVNPDGSNFTPWIDRVANILNLDYVKTAEGGAGFCNAGTAGNTFLQLLSKLSVTNKNAITDIIVGGGFNDKQYNEEAITSAITSFKNYCVTNFPNATVRVAFIGWSYSSGSIYNLNNALTYYRNGCLINGVAFMSGCEYSLRDYFSSHYTSDAVHPNDAGHNSIARNIVNCLLHGSTNVYYPYKICGIKATTNGNASSISAFDTLACTISNGLLTISTQKTLTINCPGVNHGQANGVTNFEIAQFTDGYIVGTSYNLINIPVNVVVRNSGVYYQGTASLLILNGKMYVSMVILNAEGTGYVDLSSLDVIQISRFSATFDALMC